MYQKGASFLAYLVVELLGGLDQVSKDIDRCALSFDLRLKLTSLIFEDLELVFCALDIGL